MSARAADVLIVGGGPAGAALALLLARDGIDVVLVERRLEGGDTVGESLPPAARAVLEELDLWDLVERGRPLEIPANVSVWGANQPVERRFLFEPGGPGWRLDRPRFERDLMTTAREAGAEIRLGAALRAVAGKAGSWRAEIDAGSPLKARFLVDASGSRAWLARRLGARRRIDDRLSAFCAFLEPAEPGVFQNASTLVEAARDGWWYSALLPDGRLAAAFFTDAESPLEGWEDAAPTGGPTAARLRQFQAPHKIERIGAVSARTDPLAGSGWLAVGDAASSYDPLSSHGIAKALLSARDAAPVIRRSLAGDDGGLQQYAATLASAYCAYRAACRELYCRERRWPEAPFWRKRQGDFPQ